LAGKLTAKNRYGIFDHGEAVSVELTVSGTRNTSDHILWNVKTYRGDTVDYGSCEVPRGSQPFTCTIRPKPDASGSYDFNARLEQANVTLPRQGTRPAGMLTYGILPELTALPLKSPEESRFGIQGTTFCQSGVRLSGDSYNPLYQCYGVNWCYGSARLQQLEPSPDTLYVPKLTVKELTGTNHHEVRGRLALIWDLHSVPAWMMASPKTYPDPSKASPTFEGQKYPPRDYERYGDLVFRVAKGIHARQQQRFTYMTKNYYQIHWEPDWHWLGTDEEFIKMYATAHKAIHAADPNAVLTGPNYGVIGKGNILLKRLFAKGLGKYLDGITTHAYSTKWKSPEESGLVQDMSELVRLTQQYLPPGAPIYQTEWGVNWGRDFSRIAVPHQTLMREMAWTLRAHLIILGEGATSTWFFYASDHERRGFGLAYNLDFPAVGCGPVNISPKPVTMAASHLTRLLEGTANLGRLDYLGDGVLGYAFQRKDETVAAIWSKDEADHAVILNTGAPSVKIIDCMGKTIVKETKRGRLELVVGAVPQYIVGMSPSALPASSQSLSAIPGDKLHLGKIQASWPAKCVASLSRGLESLILPDGDFTLPLRITPGTWLLQACDVRSGYALKGMSVTIGKRFEVAALRPLSKNSYRVELTNLSSEKIMGTLSLCSDIEPATKRKLVLKPNSTETFLLEVPQKSDLARTITATFTDQTGTREACSLDRNSALFALDRSHDRPIVDGALKDWQLETFTQMNTAEALAYKKAPWSGPADLSMLYSLAYDADNLYFALKVRDQTHMPPMKASEPWRGDSIQLACGLGLDGAGNAASLIKFSIELDSAKQVKVKELSSPPPIPPVVKRILSRAELKAAVVRDSANGTTSYEGAIPWKLITGTSEKPAVFGFGAMINDADNREEVEKDARKTMHIGQGTGLFNNNLKMNLIMTK
jgi:hypothetical protein